MVQAPNNATVFQLVTDIPCCLRSDPVHGVQTGSVGGVSGIWKQVQLTLGIDPVSIEVRQGGLIARVFDGLGGFLVDETARAAPAALLLGVGG